MQLRQLEYFVAVAETGSFVQGALRAHVVQSAVSTAVAGLESELGSRLIDRSHGSRLTPAGDLFLPHARSILRATRDAAEAVARARGTVIGSVTLAMMDHLGELDLADRLERFKLACPEVTVRVTQTTAGSLSNLAELRSGNVDLAFVSTSSHAQSKLTFHTVSEEPLLFVCSTEHRLASASRIRLEDIAGEPFIDSPHGWSNRTAIDAAFQAAGLSRTITMEITRFGLVRQLTRRQLGVAILPGSAVLGDGLVAVPIEPTPVWAIQLAYSSAHALSPAAEALATALLE